MAGVPNVFGNATTNIPLSQLDDNFNTQITIGTTQVGLGNTANSLANVTLANCTMSGNTALPGGGSIGLAGNFNLGNANYITLQNAGSAPAVGTSSNGAGAIFTGIGGGFILQGKGQTDDIQITNSSGTVAIAVPTGTIDAQIGGRLIMASYAYNALPTATAGGKIYVTGSGQTGFGTQLDGATSGANNWPAWSNGSDWFIG